MEFYKNLDRAFYLMADGPFTVLSNNKNGCVTIAFETKEYALKYIDENIGVINSRVKEKIEIRQVSDSYEFMQLCAKHGCAGIELLSEEGQKSIVFCVRLEEVASTLPTAMSFNKDGISTIKTRFKEFEETTYRSIKEWQRYDILDKVSAQFAINEPFRQWEHKGMFEIRTKNDEFLSLFHVPCRHNYNSLDGSIPFFTTIKLAIEFLNNPEFTNNLMFFDGGKSNHNDLAVDLSSSTDYFKIVAIEDIRERIREVNNRFMGFVVNPNGQRDSMGYGILSSGKKDYQPLFYGISGTWEINGRNEFEKIEGRDFWDGSDSFYWNRINGYKLSPLDRSFSSEATGTKLSEYTEQEIEEFILLKFEDKEFQGNDFNETDLNDLNDLNDCNDPDLNFLYNLTDFNDLQDFIDSRRGFTEAEAMAEAIRKYCIVWWCPVQGVGQSDPYFFDSILDVIAWLWDYECGVDYPARRDGARQCNGMIGVQATIDKEYEEIIHAKVLEQLIRIFRRISAQGYKPSDGEDLSGLVNGYFRTMHIDLLGYVKDLLFQIDEDKGSDLRYWLGISDDFLEREFSDCYNQIDELGASLAKETLSEAVWNKLSARARYFISSSLSQMSTLGRSPQLDYFHISVGVVKAVEYELGLLFKKFALTTDLSNISYDEDDDGESALVKIWHEQGGKPPALGMMAHLLKPNEREKNRLRAMLGEYIAGLPCGPYLSSKKFRKEAIYKITNKYRNGGVHDTAITMETAWECVDFIIGTEESEGVITKLMA